MNYMLKTKLPTSQDLDDDANPVKGGRCILKIKRYRAVEMPLSVQLWKLCSKAMSEMERETPFKQGIKQQEFEDAMSDDSFIKFVLYDEDRPIGISLVATDVSKVLWLSPSYFAHKYGTREIHYLLGIVVSKSIASRSYKGGKLLLQAVIDNFPPDGVLCYDFSQKFHPTLASFGKLMAKKNLCVSQVADTLSFCEGEHLQG